MPLVSAWFCPHTNKLFRTKEKYCCHLKKLAAKRILEFKVNQAREQRINRFKIMRQLDSFAEIENWIVEHSDVFVLGSCTLRGGQIVPKITDIKFTDMQFRQKISNTHNAPIGKPTNWSGSDDLPNGYMGWKGRVKIKMAGDYPSFTTDIFENSGICFGSGSGHRVFGNNVSGKKGLRPVIGSVYSADVMFFVDDWPGLTNAEVLVKLASE
ncbi:MAG: hypothetical protein HC836_16860 [Richelia sp. RM2_1_2]|nr:hypothetical protein [Richelia sp. RM2_1_2]